MSIGKGELFALLSALTWALGVILYKRLGEHLPPLALNLRKNLLVLAMLVPIVLATHGFSPPALSAQELAVCMASGLIGIAIADTLYFRALNRIGAGRMGVVGNFYSPFVLLLAFAFLGERLDTLQIAGFALVSLGVLIVSAPAGGTRLDAAALRRGVVLGVIAVLVMAGSVVMVKRILERHDVIWVSTIRMLGGVGGMLAPLQRGEQPALAPLGARRWLLLVGAAFVGQLLAMLWWLAGYKYTSASVAAILNETSSIFIVLLAWLLLREPLSRRKLGGVVCTLGGVACMLR